jgi:hypothetical protein
MIDMMDALGVYRKRSLDVLYERMVKIIWMESGSLWSIEKDLNIL